MNETILASVKKICNIADQDTSFDAELIIYTNTVLMELMQEWHGMDHASKIEDGTETWDLILGGDTDYEGVKELVGLKVRMMFDTPTSGSVMQAMQDQIRNLEWRLYFWKDLKRIDEGN